MTVTMKKTDVRTFLWLVIALAAAPLFLSSDSGADKTRARLGQAINGATTVAIVAAGQINEDGSIEQNYNIVKATFTAGRWQIKLKGPASDFSFRDFVVVATTHGDEPTLATTSSQGGRLLVYLMDLVTQKYVKNNFSFVVYQIKATTFSR
jgi:hypothetical protein